MMAKKTQSVDKNTLKNISMAFPREKYFAKYLILKRNVMYLGKNTVHILNVKSQNRPFGTCL